MNIQPTKDEFVRLVKKGNLIPVTTKIVADTETPVSAYHKITQNNKGFFSDYSFMLESVEGGENIGRYSFLGTNPKAIFTQNNGVAKLITENKTDIIEGKDSFEKINNVMSKYKPVDLGNLPPFIGGAVGYHSFDVVSEVETTVPLAEKKVVDTPDAFFMIADTFLIFDKVLNTIEIISHAFVENAESAEEKYDLAVEKVKKIVQQLQTPYAFAPVEMYDNIDIPEHKSNKTLEEYKDIVNKVKKYIYNGDIIQAVLSQRFEADIPYSPLAVYRASRMVNPSPYMFLLNCKDFSIVGASPEVCAKCEDRKVTVRPIAGTRVRGKNQNEDDALAKELLADPKERAEHIMLIDLARNDIGRIAETATVIVDELMIIEKYSHVMHIVSNVTGELRKDLSADSVMRATFPAGTLSGAPKVRAMQIISELEKEQRGPYGGAITFYSFNGNLNSAITIRTAVLKDNKAYVQSGAGIVADSDPQKEYEETCNKARGMMKTLSFAKYFDA